MKKIFSGFYASDKQALDILQHLGIHPNFRIYSSLMCIYLMCLYVDSDICLFSFMVMIPGLLKSMQ